MNEESLRLNLFWDKNVLFLLLNQFFIHHNYKLFLINWNWIHLMLNNKE